jgi:hypothetical protein
MTDGIVDSRIESFSLSALEVGFGILYQCVYSLPNRRIFFFQ